MSGVDLTTDSITVIFATLVQLLTEPAISWPSPYVWPLQPERDTQRKTETAGDRERGQGRMVYLHSTPQERLFRLQAHLPTYEDTVADRGLSTAAKI